MSLDDLSPAVQRILGDVPNRANRETLADFLAEKRATTSAAEGTLVMYATHLKPWAIVMANRPFSEATKKDVVRFLNQRTATRRIQGKGARAPVLKRVELKESTLNTRKTVLKQFQRWVRQDDDPPEVREVKINRKALHSPITDEDVLTDEEMRRLVEVAQSVQEKAIAAVLSDGGLRVGELCELNFGNVVVDRAGARLTLPREGEGMKTGVRTVRLLWSVPYLTAWLNDHPNRNEPKGPLWVASNTARTAYSYESNEKGKPVTVRMKTSGVRRLLARLREAAGIKKAVRPHLLRHSAVTTHLRQGLTESGARLHFGWSRESDMVHRYSHVTYGEVEKDLLERAGLLTDEEKETARARQDALNPRRCACGQLNPPRADFCERAVCGRPLSLKAAEDQRRAQAATIFDALRAEPGALAALMAEAAKNAKPRGKKSAQPA